MLKNLKIELKDLEAKPEKSDVRVSELKKISEDQHVEIDNHKAAHKLLESRFIDGSATFEQLQASQSEIDGKVKSLNDLGQLITAAIDARKEIEKKIDVKKQEIAIAQRDFCIKRRDGIFKEIQSDTKLRAKLLEAMAAQASAPGLEYTFSLKNFVQKNLTAILPDITETEAREATDRFTKENSLD